jgi:hypothetical protein
MGWKVLSIFLGLFYFYDRLKLKTYNTRYLIYCTRPVSGITFFRYAQGQIIKQSVGEEIQQGPDSKAKILY